MHSLSTSNNSTSTSSSSLSMMKIVQSISSSSMFSTSPSQPLSQSLSQSPSQPLSQSQSQSQSLSLSQSQSQSQSLSLSQSQSQSNNNLDPKKSILTSANSNTSTATSNSTTTTTASVDQIKFSNFLPIWGSRSSAQQQEGGEREFVLSGGAKNALVAVQRYYSNVATDFERQQSMDLLLGEQNNSSSEIYTFYVHISPYLFPIFGLNFFTWFITLSMNFIYKT